MILATSSLLRRVQEDGLNALCPPQGVFVTKVTPGKGSWQWEKAREEGSPSTDILGRALQKIHLGAPSFELERSPSGMVLAIVPEGNQGNRKHQQSQRGCAHLDDSGC